MTLFERKGQRPRGGGGSLQKKSSIVGQENLVEGFNGRRGRGTNVSQNLAGVVAKRCLCSHNKKGERMKGYAGEWSLYKRLCSRLYSKKKE